MSNARRTFGQLSSRWTFAAWHAGGRDAAKVLADRHATLGWLRQFRSDPMALASLRSLAGSIGTAGPRVAHRTDDQVLDDLAWLIQRGVVKVYRVAPPATAYQVEAPEQDVQTSYVPSRASSAPPPGPVAVAPEPDTFSSATDPAATAAVLQQAAEDGTPFCEECAKDSSARKAA